MIWRGIGAFLLFVILYIVISPAVGVIAFYAVDSPVVHKLIDLFGANNVVAHIVGVTATAFGSLVGTLLVIIAHVALMEERPARATGAVFILLQVANVLMILMLSADKVKFTGLFTDPLFVKGGVACVVVWVAFRLPPFKPQPSLSAGTLRWAKIIGWGGTAFVAVTTLVIIAVSH